MKRISNFFTILLLILMFAFFSNTAYASEIVSEVAADEEEKIAGAYIIVESYSITNERIIPGEPFELTLVIKNASSTFEARNTLVDITDPAGVAPEYGKVSEFYLGDIDPGSSKTIQLKYNSWTSIKTETLDFNVLIVTEDKTHSTTLRIPAGAEEPFAILSLDIPSSGKQGDSLSTSLTFKVLGEENIRDVAYIVKVDEEEKVNTAIGIMKPGATKTSATAFSIPDAGKHTIEVLLRYSDETGKLYTMTAGKETVTIEKKVNQQKTSEESKDTNEINQGPNYIGMGALAAVIVLLFFTVVLILKKK